MRNFLQFFAFAQYVKPEPDPNPPFPHPWQSLILGLPFMVFAYDTQTGKCQYAIPYSNIDEIKALWDDLPKPVLRGDRYELEAPVVDLEDYLSTFPAWDTARREAFRLAAGVEQPADPRIL